MLHRKKKYSNISRIVSLISRNCEITSLERCSLSTLAQPQSLENKPASRTNRERVTLLREENFKTN